MSHKEQKPTELKYYRTMLRSQSVYPEKSFKGTKQDEVAFDTRYVPVTTTFHDKNVSAGFIGTTYVSDAPHKNEVLDSYSEMSVVNPDWTLRANIMAVADGFGHMGDVAQIADAANKISHAFTNYMAANVEAIEGFIRLNDKEGFKKLIIDIVKKVHKNFSTKLEETASLACTMMLNIDGQYYHASVNIGDGVVWAIDRDEKTIKSLVPSVNTGYEGEEATPPAFHTVFAKQGDKISKNPLDYNEDIMSDFGEISPNTVLFVASDAQTEPLMEQIKASSEFVATPIKGEKARFRYRYSLTEGIGKKLYEELLNINDSDTTITILRKLFDFAIQFVNQKRQEADVLSCGDDHTGIAKDVGKTFSQNVGTAFSIKAETESERAGDLGQIERIDQNEMNIFRLALSLQDFLREKSKISTQGQDVARFWNKGLEVVLGPVGVEVFEELKENLVAWTTDWNNPEKSNDIKSKLDNCKKRLEADFKEIPEGIEWDDLINGYMFTVFSRAQLLDDVVALQHPSNERSEQHRENNVQIRVYLDGGEEALKKYVIKKNNKPINGELFRLRQHKDTMPDTGEGGEKKDAIKQLLNHIDDAQGDYDVIQDLVNKALKSEYYHFHQQNKMLVNRGPFHLYWLHSIFHKKINPVTGRYSRSKTEDLLIELKSSIQAAIELRDRDKPQAESSSLSQSTQD